MFPDDPPFWAICELMGHRRVAGRCRVVIVGDISLFRVDVPTVNRDQSSTHFFSPSSIYMLHVVTEEVARASAAVNPVEPLTAWEARHAAEGQRAAVYADDDGPDDDGDDDSNPDFEPLDIR